jgi:polysaccharide deacetylase 2 family uncharacterized protein YibQ
VSHRLFMGLTLAAILGIGGGAWLAAQEPVQPVADPVMVELEAEPEPVIEPFVEPVSPVAVATEEDETVQWASSVTIEPLEVVEPPAWQRHAVSPPSVIPGTPMIALMIDDMGEARGWSDRIVALPGPLTLAYFPHAPNLDKQVAGARQAGHEIMLHLPMEPDDANENPGPDPLLTSLDTDELRRRAIAMLDSIDGYVGVNNHMGSRFTRDVAAMGVVLAEVHDRGLLFVDSRTGSNSVAERLARDLGVPALRRDIFIDNDADGALIGAQLAALERHARDHGFAIGIAHPRPYTIEVLTDWLATVAERGFVLVPISAIAARDPGANMAVAE